MAFPTITTVLDDFNRADSDPISGSWVTTGINANRLKIVTNEAKSNSGTGAAHDAYSDGTGATDYGPDIEARVKVTNKATTGDAWRVYGRLKELGAGTVDGYRVLVTVVAGAGTDEWKLQRMDNGTATDLVGPVVQEISNNDQIGLEIIGTTLKGFYHSGSWTEILSFSDGTYGAAGKLGVGEPGNGGAMDNFIGGTIAGAGSGPPKGSLMLSGVGV